MPDASASDSSPRSRGSRRARRAATSGVDASTHVTSSPTEKRTSPEQKTPPSTGPSDAAAHGAAPSRRTSIPAPEQTRDDTDAGWGESVDEARRADWLREQRPPHYE